MDSKTEIITIVHKGLGYRVETSTKLPTYEALKAALDAGTHALVLHQGSIGLSEGPIHMVEDKKYLGPDPCNQSLGEAIKAAREAQVEAHDAVKRARASVEAHNEVIRQTGKHAQASAPPVAPLQVAQELVQLFRDRDGLEGVQERLYTLQEARAWIELAADLASKGVVL